MSNLRGVNFRFHEKIRTLIDLRLHKFQVYLLITPNVISVLDQCTAACLDYLQQKFRKCSLNYTAAHNRV
jgi:hypothetical protein